jgi:SAM-dependent methyltransferase
MRYEPLKRSLGRFFSGPLFMRKFFYFILDLLLLRTWHVNKALRKIRKELPDQANILDAGSGFGQYEWRLCRMNNHWKIKAVDIDKEHVEDCTLFFGKAGMSERVSFSVADLTTFSDPESYDLILSVDVMEHIREDETVFHNFHKSLRNGYSIQEITGKLAASGFNSIEALFTYGKPGNISWHLLMKYPVRMINASKLFLILLPFYYAVVFPVSMILNIFDLHLTHKKGTGLLVRARK